MKQTANTTYELREAVIKKGKNYKFGKSLSKGEKVFITEKYVGHQRFTYMAYKESDKTFTLGFGVTRSEFEYTGDIEYVVCVERIVSSVKNITVKAKDAKDAEKKAIEAAGNEEFPSPSDSEYKILSLPLTKAQHKQTYPNS